MRRQKNLDLKAGIDFFLRFADLLGNRRFDDLGELIGRMPVFVHEQLEEFFQLVDWSEAPEEQVVDKRDDVELDGAVDWLLFLCERLILVAI